MEFEWDENKRRQVQARRRLDFEDAQLLFDGRLCYDIPSDRDGETRFRRVGVIDGRMMTVVWTPRGTNVYRIISMWKSSHAEIREYRSVHG